MPPREYLDRRLTQIDTAAKRRDGDTVVAVINLIAADGHPEAAETITRGLIEQGLHNMVGGAS